MSSLCPRCQRPVSQQAKFCVFCGQPLTTVATAQPPQIFADSAAGQATLGLLREGGNEWDATPWRIASGLMAVAAAAVLWLGRENFWAWLFCVPITAGGLIHALQLPTVACWLERLTPRLARFAESLQSACGWRKAVGQPVRFLHWLWMCTQTWPSPHASAGVRMAGLLLAIGLSVLGLFISAIMVFIAVVVIVGFIVALLVFWLAGSSGFLSSSDAGSKGDAKSDSIPRSEPDLEAVIEKLKSGSYRIERDGTIVSIGFFDRPTGYKIDMDTGEIRKTGGFCSEPTGYKIQMDSGEIVKTGWLSDDPTGYRIDKATGRIVRREWLADIPTGLRIDPQSGKIER